MTANFADGESKDFVRIERLTKRFGDVTAVDNVSLNIEKGEKYGIEHLGRICFIRDFYDLLSSRMKSNKETIFTKWDTKEPHLFKVEEEFLVRWKSHAMACVENKISFLFQVILLIRNLNQI